MSIVRPTDVDASLYDEDFFAWTEQQAKLLRALKSLPAGIDIENIAEEIESLGRSDLRAVNSLIRNMLVHLLKAASDPHAPSLAHWRVETMTFHLDLIQVYSPSLRQRIDMNRIWNEALELTALSLREYDARLLPGLPKTCPFALNDFLDRAFNIDAATQRLAHASSRR